MAGNITVLPPQRSGFSDFVDAIKPGLEQAFAIYTKRQMQEAQAQRNMEQAQQMFPQAFQQEYSINGKPFTPGEAYKNQPVSAFPKDIQKMIKSKSVFNPQNMPEGGQVELSNGMPSFAYKKQMPMQPTPVYITDQTGQLTQTGIVPKGSKVLTPTQLESPEQKQERAVATSKQRKAQEAKMEVQAIDGMVNSVWGKANELIPAKESVQKAAISGLKKDIGVTRLGRLAGISDESAITFNEFKEGTLSMLIRSLGEKGMLTDQDIKRARDFEPSTWDTPTIREQKKVAMKDFLQSKISAYYQNIGNSEETTQGTVQDDPLGLR